MKSILFPFPLLFSQRHRVPEHSQLSQTIHHPNPNPDPNRSSSSTSNPTLISDTPRHCSDRVTTAKLGYPIPTIRPPFPSSRIMSASQLG